MKALKSKETPLKDMIVEYVGNKLQPNNNEVTYDMVASVLAEEFPEVIMLIAEENYLRGYHHAASDSEEFQVLYEQFKDSEATIVLDEKNEEFHNSEQ